MLGWGFIGSWCACVAARKGLRQPMAEPRSEAQPGCGTRSTDSSPGPPGTCPPAGAAPARAALPGPSTCSPPRAPPAMASPPVPGTSAPVRAAPPKPSEGTPPTPAEEMPLPLDDVRYQIACTNWY